MIFRLDFYQEIELWGLQPNLIRLCESRFIEGFSSSSDQNSTCHKKKRAAPESGVLFSGRPNPHLVINLRQRQGTIDAP